jgi:hypothetical protein
VAELRLGDKTSCAITQARKLYCWGANAHRQIDDSTRKQITSPTLVRGTGRVDLVGVGNYHICHVSGGRAQCRGQLSPLAPAVAALTNITGITAGYGHSCAIHDGKVSCWGQRRLQFSLVPQSFRGAPVHGTDMQKLSRVSRQVVAIVAVHVIAIGAAAVAGCGGKDGNPESDKAAPDPVLRSSDDEAPPVDDEELPMPGEVPELSRNAGASIVPRTRAVGTAIAALNQIIKFTSAVASAERPTLHEGLPHQMWESALLKAERRSKPVQELHGYWFYKEPLALSDEDAGRLTRLLVDPVTLARFSGEKLCGGFHPDYAVEWQQGSSTYRALIGLGCDEAKLFGPELDVRCDLREHDELAALLTKYIKNRPPSRRPRRGPRRRPGRGELGRPPRRPGHRPQPSAQRSDHRQATPADVVPWQRDVDRQRRRCPDRLVDGQPVRRGDEQGGPAAG